MTKTNHLFKLFAALLLIVSQPSAAVTTTTPSGPYTVSIQAGTAYTSVPKMDGSGGYNHAYGFQNVNEGIASVKAALMGLPNPCGTGGAVPSGGFFLEKNGYATNVYVVCNLPGGGTSNGIMGAVWPDCGSGTSYYYDFLSSSSYTACSSSGINLVKSAGFTCDAGPTSSTCSTGNHINIATGNEWVVEQDYTGGTGAYPLQFSRIYNNGSLLNGSTVSTAMGAQWISIFNRRLQISTNTNYPFVGVFREDGKDYTYGIVNGVWGSDTDVTDKLVQLPNGAGWNLTNARDETEHYDTAGKLISITNRAGFTQTLGYDTAGRVNSVTDPAGRQLTFTYDAANRLSTMTVPDTGVYTYAYDAAGNLTQVTYPDTTSKQYVYGETAYVSSSPLNGVRYTNALTGIIDENSVRYASYWYDNRGRVYKEEHAPALNLGIDRNTITYSYDMWSNPQNTVADALNTSRTYSYTIVQGVPLSTGQTQPAGSGSAAATSAQTFDANGNTTSRKDFNGNKSCYAYDLTRNLETVRVEGLAPGKACPSNLATYQPVTTTGAVERKITTQWHATYRLPTLIAEPLRISTLTYDSATGNLLTSTVQPTTDATGGAGAGGTASGTPRTTTNTYYATSDARTGQLHTVDGPRTDVTDVTTFDYDTTTGDLTSISNALSQTTTIGGYDANGRPGTITDPNGLATSLYYDGRGRLTSTTTGGETTGYTYDAVGNLTNVSLPGGASFTYTYDDAHRLTRITDYSGNYVNYTLDAAGNRTAEQVRDSANNLVTTHGRTFDALSRLYQDIGAVNQTSVFTYDANGNLLTAKDPLNRQTTNTYDALNRLATSKDALNGTTALGYDLQDQLVKVTDPRSLVTQYTLDGLGNQSQLVSPDTGTSTRTVDAAGNVLTSTDAKGQVGTFTYDALNRILTAIYTKSPATPISITYTYDQGTDGIGHLTGITEPSGTTAYGYDQHGRLSSEARTAHGLQYTTSYGYDSQGRLASIVYPSGRLISYSFDSVGRVSQISTTPTGGGTATILASNIQYQPFGRVKGFSFGDGTTAPVQGYARTFDTDGRIATYTLNDSLNTVGYDTASQITSITSALYPLIPATYGYDNVSRLTSYVQNNTSHSYGYDADGNRTTQTLGTSTTTYNIASGSNRLTGIVHGGTTAVSQDANGAVVNDFDRQYTYDLRGRLIQTTTTLGNVNFEVNALGLRVRKQAAYAGGADTMFFYDQGGHLIGEVPTGGATFSKEYVYLGDVPLAVTGGTGFNYVHTDHLGTPRVITNTGGQIVWQWDNLDPFGNNAPNENPSGLGVYHFDIGFAGQYRDRETGIVYNINRNLNTATGRYNESDLIGLAGGINTYTYVNGNPLSWKDSTGLFGEGLIPKGIQYIGKKLPRNWRLACDVHPKTGIPFKSTGFPDFSGVSKATVKIKQTGIRSVDDAAANKKMGLSETPQGFTWHHVEDGSTMELVPTVVHSATGHSGGVAVVRTTVGIAGATAVGNAEANTGSMSTTLIILEFIVDILVSPGIAE